MARRRSRAALVAGASTMVALSQCSAYGAPPPCVDSVTLHSPCGITQVTTNCTGASTSDCSSGSCSVGPIAGNCAITVTLGDGTKHVVAVDASANASCKGVIVTVPYGGNEWFVSPTCPNTTD